MLWRLEVLDKARAVILLRLRQQLGGGELMAYCGPVFWTPIRNEYA